MSDIKGALVTKLALLSFLIYILLAWYLGWQDIVNALRQTSIQTVLIPLALSLLAYCIRYLRWNYYLRLFQKRISPAGGLLIYFSGFFFAMTPGRLGELFRGRYLKSYRISYRRSASMFLVERVLDLVVLVLLSLFSLSLLVEQAYVFYILIAVLLASILLIFNVRVLLAIRKWLGRLQMKIAAYARHMIDVLLYSFRLLRFKAFITGLALGALSWVLDASGFYIIANAFQADLPYLLLIGIYSASVLLGVISLLPGGVGTTELLMFGFLGLLKVPAEHALVIIMLSRITTMWFSVVLGGLAMSWLERQKNNTY